MCRAQTFRLHANVEGDSLTVIPVFATQQMTFVWTRVSDAELTSFFFFGGGGGGGFNVSKFNCQTF
jgi:hypothetical protein